MVELALGALEEMPAVAAHGQHVGGGQAVQLAFQLFLLGDVFGDADDDGRQPFATALADEALVADPAQLAVGAQDAVLTSLDGALLQHLGEAARGVFQVVRVDAVAPLVVVGHQQGGGAAEHALVGGADIDDPLGIPVEGPEHGVHAAQQAAVDGLAFAQPLHLATAMEQGEGEFFKFAWRFEGRFHSAATYIDPPSTD
ncbi:hypothetical protein D9M69_554790 [compost metagenome]